jgi:hypothetical protein
MAEPINEGMGAATVGGAELFVTLDQGPHGGSE